MFHFVTMIKKKRGVTVDKAYTGLDDLFIAKYLAKSGESIEEAKERLEIQRVLCLEKEQAKKSKKIRESQVACDPVFKSSEYIGQASFLDDQFVAHYLVRDGESVEDAKKRLRSTHSDKLSPD